MSKAGAAVKPRRRDAALSRARILQAAGAVFARHGFDVPLSEVAAAAGVGVATLSRHFTRPQLVEAVAAERLAEHIDLAEQALAVPPADAVFTYLWMLSERRFVDKGICHAITLRLAGNDEVAELRARLRDRQIELIQASRQAGTVRAEVVPQDLILFLEAISAVMETTTGDAAWRRLFAILQVGLAPDAHAVALPDPPQPADLLQTETGPPRGRRTSPVVETAE